MDNGKKDPVLNRTIRSLASSLFGGDDNVKGWLRRPVKPLDNAIPAELMQTQDGARKVEIYLRELHNR
jgi:uncharacterized protein (DUF2384 family)